MTVTATPRTAARAWLPVGEAVAVNRPGPVDAATGARCMSLSRAEGPQQGSKKSHQ